MYMLWLLTDLTLKFQLVISNHVTHLDNVAIETIVSSVMVSSFKILPIIIINNILKSLRGPIPYYSFCLFISKPLNKCDCPWLINWVLGYREFDGDKEKENMDNGIKEYLQGGLTLTPLQQIIAVTSFVVRLKLLQVYIII